MSYSWDGKTDRWCTTLRAKQFGLVDIALIFFLAYRSCFISEIPISGLRDGERSSPAHEAEG